MSEFGDLNGNTEDEWDKVQAHRGKVRFVLTYSLSLDVDNEHQGSNAIVPSSCTPSECEF